MKNQAGVTKRKLTPGFKVHIVEEVLSGRATSAQVARRYGLSGGQISDWITDYEEGRLGAVFNSIEDDPNYMRGKIAELERVIGQLTLENAYLKKANRFVIERKRRSSSILTAKILGPSVKRAR
jgi:transposase-like protein